MLNRRLLEVIQRLNATERKQLRLFLASPYFNSGSKMEAVVEIFDFIVKYDADENAPQLQKERVFSKFFPELRFEPNIKSPLDPLTSELFRLVRLFLQQTAWEQQSDEMSENLVMAKFYRRHGLEDRFWQTMEQIRKTQSESPYRDVDYHFRQFKIEEEELNFRGLYNSFEDDANLNAVQFNLNHYFVSLKLGYIAALEFQKLFTSIKSTPITPIDEAIFKLSKEEMVFDTPINQIYHLIINVLQNKGVSESFESLEKAIQDNKHLIDPERLKNLVAFQRSLWIRRYMQSGGQNVSRYVFDLYRDHLAQGVFYLDNAITLNAFYNITILALKVGEYEWVLDFLNAHPPEQICGTRYPHEVHSLCKAEYYFNVKNYDAAEHTLEYKLFENTFMSISADMLLVKIYVETQNELLETRMAALYKKVKRSKFTEDKKEVYLNFLSKLGKMIKLGPYPDRKKRAKLIEEVRAMTNIASRDWLLEKLGA